MANAQDRVVPILEQFNKTPDAATANRFFDELQKAEFTDEKITFANNTPIDSLRQQVWYWAAEWLYDQQQYEQAEQYALKALPKYHPANPEKADCLNTLGCIYIRLSDFKQAANYAKQSVEIEMKGGDHDRIASSMNTLAGIYMAGYQAKEAEQIILQAIDHINQVDNPGRKAIILGMASEIYHTLGNDSKALPYAEQAIDIEQQLGRKPKLAIRLSQKGSALLGLHRYKEAEDIYRLILPEFKEMGDYHSYAIALNHLGMSLLCQKRQQEAIPYYRQAAELFSKMGDLYNEIHAHRGLYESYWDINPDSAKIELDYFDLLKDSLYTNATAEALSRYNAEFGNDQLQQENEEVRSAYQRTIIIAIVVLLIVIALAWLIVYNTRLREKRRIEALMQEISLLRTKMVQTTPQTTSEEKGTEVPAISESNEGRLFLMRVIDVVNDGFADRQWSVEVIASKLNMSVQTFRRRLMATAGESPKAFISAIQMEKAGKLLTEHPDMPIVDVAFKCGFDEASSFTHTFKRIYGLTPSQYRERHLNSTFGRK
jgi:AraC-like DNA-binding protein/tetratricopeptide (TPR) repeat protein